MKFSDIPQFTRDGNYRVNVSWAYLEQHLAALADSGQLDLDPDFQRGHVWTEDKQIAYVEFVLRGGKSSRTLLFNAAGWMRSFAGDIQLVDGKQRLEAVLRFLHGEIRAFGLLIQEFEGKLPGLLGPDFVFCINDLKTRKEVLTWYLELNGGGVVHTEEELARVQKLLEETE